MSHPALLALLVRAVCSVLLCSFPVAACKGDAGAAPKAVSADAGTAAAASSACAEGYEKKGGKCVDIDECGGVANVCGPHPEAKCSNKPGTYECACPEGFVGGGPGGFGCAPSVAGLQPGYLCSIEKSGSVECWEAEAGKYKRHTPSHLQGLRDVVALTSAAPNNGCALLRGGGTVWCWGDNDKGQIGDGSTVARSTPTQVKGVYGAVAIVSSRGLSCALLRSGGVSCWGANSFGALGRGTTGGTGQADPVKGVTDAVAISNSLYRTCALRRDGHARCWGSRAISGEGSEVAPVPVDVPFVERAIQLAVDVHACFLRSDRTVWCWGRNAFGELGNGNQATAELPQQATDLDQVTLIGVGREETRALRQGAIYRWGRDYLVHPGQGGSGYDATKVEKTVTPAKVDGVTGVLSMGRNLRDVHLAGGASAT